MPHLVFIAKGRDVGMYRLTDLKAPLILGRDVECDIYVPDIFVSRHHCRFEPLDTGEWAVVDARSRNGIHYNGHRVFRRLLRHGDTIEIGSVAFQFDESDLAPTLSSQTPFGEGTKLAALVDTVFTEGLRPNDWLKRRQKKPAWVKAAEEAEARKRAEEEEAAAEARAIAERLDFSEPTELDLELQLGPINGDDELTPSHVLVPVELARRVYALGDAGGGVSAERVYAGAGAASGAGAGGDAPALGDLAALASLAPAAASNNGPGPGAAGAGLGGVGMSSASAAADHVKRTNLWEAAEGRPDAAEESGKKKKKEKKAKKPKEVKVKSAGGSGIGSKIGDFVADIPDLLRSMTLTELMEIVAEYPKRAAGVAAVVLIPLITVGVMHLTRPKYRLPPRYLKDGTLNPVYRTGDSN